MKYVLSALFTFSLKCFLNIFSILFFLIRKITKFASPKLFCKNVGNIQKCIQRLLNFKRIIPDYSYPYLLFLRKKEVAFLLHIYRHIQLSFFIIWRLNRGVWNGFLLVVNIEIFTFTPLLKFYHKLELTLINVRNQ